MTSGSLWKNLLLFSLPLMGSQVLEVLFNLSDVAVVGRFADYMALGAVGSTTLLVTLFTGILIGMGAGVNVRVAHELGAENRKGTEETIHTSLLLCAIAGLLVCVVCLLFSGQMLSMMNTKPELMEQAVLYMKIYALGMPAMAVYNFGNGVLSARGDTKRPLIYLSIAGVINVLLNLFFVIVCHMAAAGVATASAIALYISAALVMIHLLRRKDECRVSLHKLRLHPKACKSSTASWYSHRSAERNFCHCKSVRTGRRQLLRCSHSFRKCCRCKCRLPDLQRHVRLLYCMRKLHRSELGCRK